MRLFRRVGLDHIAWSLRCLHCPVAPEALVLEVGSGGNPYPRANVLLDAYEVTRQRHWVPLKTDRPTVLGFVEHLPFKDKAFDFVIASHVLEHSADPDRFLSELQRVGRGGYIEVPDAFMERIIPYRDHRLEVTARELAELYAHRASDLIGGRLIPAKPFDFHVRFYWKDRIDFVVVNPEIDAGWSTDDHLAPNGTACSGSAAAKERLLDLARLLLSQQRRNRALSLYDLLRCPTCTAESLQPHGDGLRCGTCLTDYPVRNGIPVLYPRSLHE
jgi:SAM-dependent methyltransferase